MSVPIGKPPITAAGPNWLTSGTTSAPTYPTVGGTGTTIKVFPVVNNSAAAVYLNIPGNGEVDGQRFNSLFGGSITVATTSSTVTIALYKGSSISSTTTAVWSASQSNLVSGTYNWAGSFTGFGTTASTDLDFLAAASQIATTTQTVTTTEQTGLKFNTSSGTDGYPQSNAPVISFIIGVTFATSTTLNAATLTQWTLES